MALILVGVAVLVLIVFSAFFWASGQIIGLGLHLLMAGLVGALADAVVPGTLPWGWAGAIAAGLLGSWLGVTVLGHLGPSLFGVAIIPGFLGAVVLAFALSLLTRQRTA